MTTAEEARALLKLANFCFGIEDLSFAERATCTDEFMQALSSDERITISRWLMSRGIIKREASA
jgi:hypothetical protein